MFKDNRAGGLLREVLVLCTFWKSDYWESDKVAPYPKMSTKPVQHLKDMLPLAGIGVYTKGKGKDYTHQSPCFLIIKGITENEKGEPQFDFHYVSKMQGIKSSELLNKMGKQGLFFTVPGERVLSVLKESGIEPPIEWQKLLEIGSISAPSWQDWIGKRFLDILQQISNDDYEDRIAEILKALGFEVEQLGHRKEGEYPDGIAYAKDFAIIYDCKNSFNYSLKANDRRAIIKYIQDAKKKIKEQRGIEKSYFAIIAHSYSEVKNISDIEKETFSIGFLLTSEAMLYLLFKKISLGRSFLLANFEKLPSNQVITVENVEKVYGRGI
ncbi:hypothetical protein D6D85_07870 [Candidatus Methanodesulfokora washburnensis]|jgi:hypothetical protein|uniref:Uncharacterized protein n=1 Tax=Candidatus Methanodesulfokora washburnensis TaxID=2478471 RepID=A0A429GL27_9CREN|nr:hypothetical protein D6D85_07870 [Candidatus Methanodesulfokores washburnensis]